MKDKPEKDVEIALNRSLYEVNINLIGVEVKMIKRILKLGWLKTNSYIIIIIRVLLAPKGHLTEEKEKEKMLKI